MTTTELEATHDTHGFYDQTDDAQTCVYCRHLASVFDIEYLCDKHWLFCPDCGTGIYKGIEFACCPSCDKIRNYLKEIAS